MSEEQKSSQRDQLRAEIEDVYDTGYREGQDSAMSGVRVFIENELGIEVEEDWREPLRALARSSEPTSRWNAFSDQELESIRHAILGDESYERVRMCGEVCEVIARRRLEAERLKGPSYRGPGIYRYVPGGWTFEVMGMLEEGSLVIAREKSGLKSIDCRYFEETCTAYSGKAYRRFEYVRPLPRTGEAP